MRTLKKYYQSSWKLKTDPRPVGSLSWQRGAAEPSPSNNPQVVRNGTPFHTPYEQQ
ncbi:unnamed protein product [Penicillium roqueforti FM164]|uniref:Genomic scaffold, ProqFM164S02 n=1 Tax=Penicillium roqueforti (strain FM164) TaxID=1365484 RepID=W6Q739_PENRF|nr:unnamed protein product [Penicillium roqueforti FM164]CDM32763.1 unnamed protein product [Penicillium roqueforti FM164]